jgi:uncharacterized protein (TIGR03083 family)
MRDALPMDRDRYLALLAADGEALRAAARDLDAAVPDCPGWTVRDAVTHTSEVYEHKLACIALAGARPEPWPPEWPAGRDPVEWYSDALGRVLDALRGTDPAAPSWTWWPQDQTAGFWVRRMAQETAVHRVDVERASGTASPVDADLAGDWSTGVEPDLTGTAVVSTGRRSWLVAMAPAEVTVSEPGGEAAATVSGDPSAVLLWLWGRAADDAVHVEGDRDVARRLRERLAIATQ